MSSTPLVSVVVPTFNRRASLGRLLEALERQTYPNDRFEVVVVDDGSSDGTVEWLRGYRARYPLRVMEQAHEGPSAARNRGVAAANGTLVLFLDDDVVPLPECIAEHVAVRSGMPEAEAVVIGPMSPPRDWPRPVWVRWVEDTLQEQYRAMQAGEFACSPRQFYTANASLPRARFLEVGGFDAEFKRNEDVELAYRLQQNGLAFIFHPRADVLHYAGHSLEAWQAATYQYGRYDVVQTRDRGGRAFLVACTEFRGRHPLNRLAARLCTGRPLIYRGAVWTLVRLVRVADRESTNRAAKLALSALFTILYWQGACDELGSRRAVWENVAERA
ncbi:MAG: glycosyltransferase [Chloroflexota bacterium]|nr:glycosyltransferase [Chloroflexota bacterium]